MTFYGGRGGGFDFDPPVRSSSSQTQSAPIQELQLRVERLHLMIQTMSRLLIAKGIMEEQELNEWMRYVDSLDGKVDGKLRPGRQPTACPQCKRMNPPTAGKCQYCGAEMPSSFIDKMDET